MFKTRFDAQVAIVKKFEQLQKAKDSLTIEEILEELKSMFNALPLDGNSMLQLKPVANSFFQKGIEYSKKVQELQVLKLELESMFTSISRSVFLSSLPHEEH